MAKGQKQLEGEIARHLKETNELLAKAIVDRSVAVLADVGYLRGTSGYIYLKGELFDVALDVITNGITK